MYHSISQRSNQVPEIYAIPEQLFIQHIDFLESQQNLTEYDRIVPFASSSPTGISITFDDGYSDTLSIGAKLLCAKSIPFTVFVTPKNIESGDTNYLNKNQLIELSKMPGVTIGSHGLSHLHLADLPDAQARTELVESKNWIEQVIGKPIDTMSYPHGSFNHDVMQITSDAGYRFAATSQWGFYRVGENQLAIPRIDVWGHDTSKSLNQKLRGKWNWIAGLI